jgi:hypothetical protein
MKPGDLVQKTISGSIEKHGIIIDIAKREYCGGPMMLMCVLTLWDDPDVGLRWVPMRGLEVISESR